MPSNVSVLGGKSNFVTNEIACYFQPEFCFCYVTFMVSTKTFHYISYADNYDSQLMPINA